MNYFSTSQPKKESDGDWIFSYADLMTLLLGFFIILYSFSSVDDKKFDQMAKEMSETFKGDGETKKSDSDYGITNEKRQIRALQMLVAMLNLGSNLDHAVANIEKNYSSAQSLEKARAMIQSKIPKEVLEDLNGTIEMKSHQTVEILLPAGPLFASGSNRLTKKARRIVEIIAGEIEKTGNIIEVEIIGHTDSVEPNSRAKFSNNFALSSARAGALASVFIRNGVDKKIISVKGMGSLRPLLPELGVTKLKLANNRKRNRRVQILLKKARVNETSH